MKPKKLEDADSEVAAITKGVRNPKKQVEKGTSNQ